MVCLRRLCQSSTILGKFRFLGLLCTQNNDNKSICIVICLCSNCSCTTDSFSVAILRYVRDEVNEISKKKLNEKKKNKLIKLVLHLGEADAPDGASAMVSTGFKIRYQYLTGDVNDINQNWLMWQEPGPPYGLFGLSRKYF